MTRRRTTDISLRPRTNRLLSAVLLPVVLSGCGDNGEIRQPTRSVTPTAPSPTDSSACPDLDAPGRPDPTSEAYLLSDKLAAYRDGPVDTGYGDAVLAGGNRVEIWWRGRLPDRLQQEVSATDVVVTVHAAPYTHRQVYARMAEVDLHDQRIAALGITIDAWAMSCGASGLVFTYVPGPDAAHADRIRSRLEAVTGIRVLDAKVAAPALPDGPLTVSPT